MEKPNTVLIFLTVFIFLGIVLIGTKFYSSIKFGSRPTVDIPDEKTFGNQVVKNSFDANITNEETKFKDGTSPKGDMTVTKHSEIDALEELSLKIMPTQFKSVAKLMYMEIKNFNQSPDKNIQQLISRHNTTMSSVSHIKFDGLCVWNAIWGSSKPFHLDLTRKGFNVVCQCGQECIEVKNGAALFSEKVDKDCLDTYYLMAFSVFNPKEFTSISNDSIQISLEDGNKAIDVYKVSSPEKVLYFDRKDSRLVRVDLKQIGVDSSYASLDFMECTTINGIDVPTKIQVTFPKAEEMRANNKFVPEKMVLQIDAKTIEY